ncbi:STAS domain-containing protein [Rhizomicrobium electricum]|uniref:STAS domain-containing protein n=1 Tax=Rhizomicrobium electricum TaxID=480070 RepID=A0ABN1EA66_9PROT|nr:hypothetical protein [Rhizomicrobium electricum]
MHSETTTAFRLCGEQTVRTIADTHSALLEYYAAAPNVVFDPTAITEADLSVVQLVESARQTAARDGKKICIAGPLPVSLRDVLVRGGFLNSPEDALFWATP